ncbi:hypothetical protein Csa_005242 [Cucumis sativus]|nr:hypothetical protein Csa_005242 [Cucumis sativus]
MEIQPNSFLENVFYQDSIGISLKGIEQQLEINLLIFKTIDLSPNGINGEIRKEIGMLKSLVGLNLSHNKLTGKQFDTFESSSYLGNLGLCGNLLPKCDADQNDHKPQLWHEQEEDNSLEKRIWVKAVFMGYGCGMVFGVFIGYVVFKCGKPMWIVASGRQKSSKDPNI